MNYLKTAFKFLRRNKLFASINILGLSLALAVSFILMLYIINEMSYNSMHKNRDHVYRVVNHYKDFGSKQSATPYRMAVDLKKSFPQIEMATNINSVRIAIKLRDEWIKQRALCTTSDIFNIFTIPILQQSKGKNLLQQHNDIVISKSLSQNIFGDKNPLGKAITISINGKEEEFNVVAVHANLPKNSSFQSQCLINSSWGIGNLKSMLPDVDNPEEDYNLDICRTWIKTTANTDVAALQQQFNSFLKTHGVDTQHRAISLQSLSNYYLNSSDINNSTRIGNKKNLQLISMIVALILMVATLNYITLSTAISSNRAKEIGIRKNNGASKLDIRWQLLSESVLVALLALPLSVVLAYVLLPFGEQLFHHSLLFIAGNTAWYIAFIFALPVIIGLISGLYNTSYLSKSCSIDLINKKPFIGKKKSVFLSVLIGVQLLVFCIFVTSSFIIRSQYKYALNKDLGLRMSDVLFIDIPLDKTKYKRFLEQVNSFSTVVSAAGSTDPLPTINSSRFRLNHFVERDKKVSVEALDVDFAYLETLGIKIKEGRSFSKKYSSDLNNAVIVNQAAVDMLGIDNPIGKKIEERTIIGITNDFILHSIHASVPPLIIYPDDEYMGQIAIHYQKGQLKQLLPELKSEWQKTYQNIHFRFHSSEEIQAEIYSGEHDFLSIVALAGIFTFVIAMLGLFGITLFVTQSRIKEIGIRKVMGSSKQAVVFLLLKSNIYTTIIAVIIAFPVTYLLMTEWLKTYAYSVQINIGYFVLSAFIAVIVVVITVFSQAYKTANRNPVEALRYE